MVSSSGAIPRSGARTDGRASAGSAQRRRVAQPLEGQDLEQDRAEREHVRGRADRRIRHLLGRHVQRRAHQLAGDRQPRGLLARLGRGRRPLVDQPREPPVEHVDLAEVAEHHVRGLEVAVDHATAVRVVDGQADRRERGQQLALGVARPRRRRARAQVLEDRVQGPAEHAPHREERGAVGTAIDVVDRHDRGVLELALDARLAEEPRALLGPELRDRCGAA